MGITDRAVMLLTDAKHYLGWYDESEGRFEPDPIWRTVSRRFLPETLELIWDDNVSRIAARLRPPRKHVNWWQGLLERIVSHPDCPDVLVLASVEGWSCRRTRRRLQRWATEERRLAADLVRSGWEPGWLELAAVVRR